MDRPSAPAEIAKLIRRTATIALSGAALLFALHATFFLTWRFRDSLPHAIDDLFDVTSEQGLLTWWTVTTNTILAMTLLLLAGLNRASGRSHLRWIAAGLLFLFLAVDDAAGLHERVGWIATPLIGVEGLYVWVLVLGPVFAALGVWVFAHLWRSLSFDRGAQMRCLLAFAFLGTALGLEALEKALVDSTLLLRGLPLYGYTIAIEELLEAAAPALLLTAMARRIEHEFEDIGRGELLQLDPELRSHTPRRTA